MGAMFKAAAIQMQNRVQAIALLEDMDARIAKAKSEGSTEVRFNTQPAKALGVSIWPYPRLCILRRPTTC
jgi:hypothetical protein